MVGKIIGIVFVLFIILGVLFGLGRGLGKSTIRLITVLLSAVIALLITPLFTQTLLTFNLSSYGLNIGSVPVTTVQETVVNYLKSIETISEAVAASPTTSALIIQLPAAIVNIFLFILLFFIVKAIMWIVYVIFSKIIVKKTDANGDPKNKHRLTGALVGLAQGICVFAIVLLPIAGFVNFCETEINYINSYSEAPAQAVSYNTYVVNADDIDGGNNADNDILSESDGEANAPLADTLNTASTYLSDFNKSAPLKVLNKIGYKFFSKTAINKLTTMKINEEKTTLTTEIDCIVRVYVRADSLLKADKTNITKANLDSVNEIIDIAFESKVVPNILNEFVVGATTAWTAETPTAFLAIEKPSIEGAMGTALDAVFKSLKASTTETLKSDLKGLVQTAEAVRSSGVLGLALNGGDANSIIDGVANESTMEAILGGILSGPTIKSALPNLIQSGLDLCYPMMQITPEESANLKITKKSSDVNWDTEKSSLAKVLVGFAKVYKSLNAEGDIIDKIDFDSLALALTNIRNSQLLNCEITGGSTLGKELTVLLITKNFGSDPTVIAPITNTIKTNYSTMNFGSTLKTLSSSIKVARSMQQISGGTEGATINNTDLVELLNGLTEGTTSSVITELASEDNLVSLGVPAETAGAVSSIIESVSEYNGADGSTPIPTEEEDIEKAKTAVETLYSTLTTEGGTNTFFNAKADLKTFIDNIKASAYVYQMTINNGENLGFKDGLGNTLLTATEYTWLTELIASESYVQADMQKLFGTQP